MLPVVFGPSGPSWNEVSTGSKITALAVGWIESWVIRCDSRDSGVAESFSQCGFSLTDYCRLGPVLRNGLPGVGSARSGDTVDGQWPRWFDCVPGVGPSGDTRSRRCFLWSWLRRWPLD